MTQMKPTKAQAETARLFATGKPSARKELRGKTFDEALRRGHTWSPTLGGVHVACPAAAPHGFKSRVDAVSYAKQIKAQTVEWAAKHGVEITKAGAA